MTLQPTIAFHMHLVQDVAVIRPLVGLARALGPSVVILVSSEFASLDPTGRWRDEIGALCQEFDVPSHVYANEFEAHCLLQGRSGLLIAGSESDVASHAATHRLFRSRPPNFTMITLQHGFECIGFLHNAAHDRAAGRSVRFAADILAGWFRADRLTSVTPAERAKLFIAGPPSMAGDRHAFTDCAESDPASAPVGMVCENLHSDRFAGAALKADFFDTFGAFATIANHAGAKVHLRSHPAGRFSEKSGMVVPPHVRWSRDPLYRVSLRDFTYAISGPSSILFDFVLADVPVAVWSDPTGQVDIGNYTGLATVGSAGDWWMFAAAATDAPQRFLRHQHVFLRDLGMPSDIRASYRRLLSMP